MEAIVQIAFKSVQHVDDIAEPCCLQCQASVQRAFATAANQHNGARLVSCFALNLAHKLGGVRAELGVLVPGNGVHARRAANVKRLNFHADIDKQRLRAALQQGPCGLGEKIFHHTIVQYCFMGAISSLWVRTENPAFFSTIQG